MSELSPVEFLRFVVRPALSLMGHPYNDHAVSVEQLLVGTAVKESGGFLYLRQNSAGPALGVFQMEPATFYDLWSRVPVGLKPVLVSTCGMFNPPPDMVAWNHIFGAIMARLKYRDDPNPLPDPFDIAGLAWAWKSGYNSVRGKGTTVDFVASWQRYVTPCEQEMWPQ